MIVVASRDVELVGDELDHHVFQLASGIWPWPMQCVPRARSAPKRSGNVLDVVHAVVDKIDLPAAVQLAQHGVCESARR